MERKRQTFCATLSPGGLLETGDVIPQAPSKDVSQGALLEPRDETSERFRERLVSRSGEGSIERLVEKFLQLREELGISSIMLGMLGELEPVLERLSGR